MKYLALNNLVFDMLRSQTKPDQNLTFRHKMFYLPLKIASQ